MAQTFGALLRILRRRHGMTQSDLALKLGYSRSLVAALELNQRLPDIDDVAHRFVTALGLLESRELAAQLVELAALARNEHLPASSPLHHRQHAATGAEDARKRHPIPIAPTKLLGRDKEVNLVCDRFLELNARLLTLVGPPGVGKTRLAQAVASRLEAFYTDGAYFVPLAAVTNPEFVIPDLLTKLGVQDGSSRPAQSRLIAHLRRKELLLLLDNFEQLLAAGPLLAEVIAECAGVRILATSRERLHLRPEQYVRVQPLSLEASVELFVQRAATVDAGFALSATNRHTIEAICTRLDCLPLGLELCAAQMELFSAAQLLVQINDRPLELLQEGANDLQPHQRTLRAAIQTGYDLLDSEQRALLRSLSIFSGGCDLEAVREVGAWAIDAPLRSLSSMLRALLAKSLVNVEAIAGGEKRFALLETVREFALEQVRAEGAIQALHARHFATYLNLARVADSHLRQPEAAFWFAQLDLEHDNIRAALQWALDDGKYTDAAWLVLAIQFYWHQRGHLEEAADWIEQLLPYCPEMETDLHVSIKITYVAKAHALTRPVAMSRITEDLIALMDSCSDTLISSAAWYWIAATLPDFLQATVALERSVTLARAGSSTPETRRQFCLLSEGDFMLPQHLWGYASRLIDQGETAQATALTAENLALFRMCGDTRGVGECLGNLGRLAFLRGENGEARTLFLSVIDVGAKLGDREMLCTWQPRLGLATLYAGDTSEARRLLLESLSFCREVQNSHLLSRACCYLAEFALWQQELEQAGEWLAQSLGHHAEPHHFTVLQIRRLHVAARLAAARGSNTRAATLFGLVQAIRNRIGVELRGPMRSLEEAAMESMRARLDTSTFAAAFAAGQQLTLAEAFATILAPA